MISPEVMKELLSVRQVLHFLPASASTENGWTEHEQHLFWVALALYPQGPWTTIAEYIGTKSTRQTMTHGQKLRQKLKRWNERLRLNPTASMLMDGVAVTASADCVVGANVAIGTMEPLNTESSMTTIACDNPHPSSPFLSSGHHGVAPAGLLVDDVRITSDFRIDDTEHTFALTPAVEPDHSLAPTSSYGQPRSARPNISADTARIVDLMLSESSEEVMLTDISDDPEILPQHLLDDLLEILSDEDINELNQHQ